MLNVEVRAKELPRGGSKVLATSSTEIVKILAYPTEADEVQGIRVVVNPHKLPGLAPSYDVAISGDRLSMEQLCSAITLALAQQEHRD